MFNKKFIVTEIRQSGVIVKHYLNGKSKAIEKDIEYFKRIGTIVQKSRKEMVVVL